MINTYSLNSSKSDFQVFHIELTMFSFYLEILEIEINYWMKELVILVHPKIPIISKIKSGTD